MKKKRSSESTNYRFKSFARKSFSAFASLKKIVSIGVIAGCTLTMMSGSAVAQDGQKPVRQIEKELEEVLVTASLIESPLEEAAKTITIISKSEIEQTQPKSINDLLAYVGSIDLVQRGAHGVQADLSIRGSSSDQVAVLINGIPLSNTQTGHYSLDLPINISDIERIEILHGPSALVYGSSSFSGGINIITKKEGHEKAYINIEGGMHNLKAIEGRVSLESNKSINSISASYKSSDGYVNNSDYDIYNLFYQSRLKLPAQNKIDLQLGFSDKKYGANTFYSPEYPNQYEETSTYLATIKGDFGKYIKFKPSIYWNRHHDKFDLIKGTTTGQNFHRNDTYGASLVIAYTSVLGKSGLVGEIKKDEIMSSKLGKPMIENHRKYSKYDARTSFHTGIEHTFIYENIILSGGVLLKTNSMRENKVKLFPSLSFSYSPIPKLKIYTSWSKSERLPTFTDLYYTTETHTANETLKAEQSESLEIGTKHNNKYLEISVSGYLLWGRNMIDWIKENAEDDKWMSWNHTKINSKGIEVGVKLNLNALFPGLDKLNYFKIEYSQISQSADSKKMVSLYSLNYLKSKLSSSLNIHIKGGFSISLFHRLQNRAGHFIEYENLEPKGKKKYPIFSTLDVKLRYDIKNISIYTSLNNIYNTKYYDLGNIPQPGFWLMGGISYKL